MFGLTRLLEENDWLPKQSGCSLPLWAGNQMSTASDRVVCIPPGSTLAIDGNGLAFHLHNVAYSRHFCQVTGSSINTTTKNGSYCTCKRQLIETQVTKVLPQSLPLDLLDQVTREFVNALHANHCKIVVYWDGPDRRMKADTTQKRFEQRTEQWCHLQQYCLFGTLPMKTPCQKLLLRHFPVTRMLTKQVHYTLSSFHFIDHVICSDEADREVALASHKSPTTFSVGLDSDYCLFPNIKYVPLTTINVTGNIVTARLITRQDLVELLDLPCEQSIVELGILQGNDYVGDARNAQLDFTGHSVESVIQHLKAQGPHYQASSTSAEVQLAIYFSRALYAFEDISEYPLDETDQHCLDGINWVESINAQSEDSGFVRPILPAELDLELAHPNASDSSLTDVVIRPIQAYIDSMSGIEGECRISQKHLHAWVQVAKDLVFPSHEKVAKVGRPHWDDIVAAYIIEATIEAVIQKYQSSILVLFSSPSKIFDQSRFYLKMNTTRNAIATQIDASEKTLMDSFVPVERTELPIDEYEGKILDTIQRQRVTIIHGETGCGYVY